MVGHSRMNLVIKVYLTIIVLFWVQNLSVHADHFNSKCIPSMLKVRATIKELYDGEHAKRENGSSIMELLTKQ